MVAPNVVEQGNDFWIDLSEPVGSGPGFRRPGVVIQSDRINRSALSTVLVCPLTSTFRHAEAPGNDLLAKGEGNLSRRSVAVVSGTTAIDRSLLSRKIGKLSKSRLYAILDGLMVIVAPD